MSALPDQEEVLGRQGQQGQQDDQDDEQTQSRPVPSGTTAAPPAAPPPPQAATESFGTTRLNNPDYFRQRPGETQLVSPSEPEEGPLGRNRMAALGSVLQAAGHKGPKSDEQMAAERRERNARAQPNEGMQLKLPQFGRRQKAGAADQAAMDASDADPVRSTVADIGGQLAHLRDNLDGSFSGAHLGSAGAPDVGDPMGPSY